MGSEIISNEIWKRMVAANKCYYGLNKYMKTYLISNKSKLNLYKDLTKPVTVYTSETCTLTKADKNIQYLEFLKEEFLGASSRLYKRLDNGERDIIVKYTWGDFAYLPSSASNPPGCL